MNLDIARHNNKCGFLGLPQEIRLIIYGILLDDQVCLVRIPGPSALYTMKWGIVGSLAILQVNKQVYAEARQMLQIRTIRISQLAMGRTNLLERLPQLLSKYVHMVRSLVIHISDASFERISTRSDLDLSSGRLIREVIRKIVVCFPNVKSLILSCDHLYRCGADEDWIADSVRRFRQPLQGFDTIATTIRERSEPCGTCGARSPYTEIRFSKNDRAEKLVRPENDLEKEADY